MKNKLQPSVSPFNLHFCRQFTENHMRVKSAENISPVVRTFCHHFSFLFSLNVLVIFLMIFKARKVDAQAASHQDVKPEE